MFTRVPSGGLTHSQYPGSQEGFSGQCLVLSYLACHYLHHLYGNVKNMDLKETIFGKGDSSRLEMFLV